MNQYLYWFLVFAFYFLYAYQSIIFIYVLMSWFPNFRGSGLHRLLYRIVEPYLGRFRRIIPPIGGFDFSVLLGFLLLQIAMQFIGTVI